METTDSDPRTLYTDLGHLARRAGTATRDVERLCTASVRAQPFAAVAAAAGLGFVLGGGLQRGLVTLLLGTGVRLAASRVGERLLEYADDFVYAGGREEGPR
jgi:hypothetical protein